MQALFKSLGGNSCQNHSQAYNYISMYYTLPDMKEDCGTKEGWRILFEEVTLYFYK
jgi:choline dehydrogenase-like flavoprotein